MSNPFRYDGTLLDSGTGLYKMGERYYDPSTGRWTQRDRLAGSLSVPQSLNRYAFVLGDPIGGVDPLGTDCADEGFSFAVLGVGAALLGLEPVAFAAEVAGGSADLLGILGLC